MSSNSDNIEERLIPYIEGVLNEREQREVEEAIEADPGLAREVEELREVVGGLRKAFASGVVPRAEELSVEEVVSLAFHDGNIDTMPGTAEQKRKLFCNDQSLDEYRLLRSLSQDMQQTTLPMAEIPPMPQSMLAEIARYKSTDSAASKVVEFAPKLGREKPALKGGWFGFLDRLDPKPLMATAAALVLFSMGFHAYSSRSASGTAEPQVAFGYHDTSASPAAPASPVSEVATTDGKSVVAPTGVTVFTSGDRDLLKEQAEKLLEKKVRYTVTEDRILVAEDEVAQARAVLWGDEEAATVAMAEKSKESKLRADSPAKPDDFEPEASLEEVAVESGEPSPAGYQAPPIKVYDTRSGRKKGVADDGVASVEADKEPGAPDPGEGSALRRKDENEPQWSRSTNAPVAKESPASLETGSASASVKPGAAGGLKGASKEERERILREMALGQTRGQAEEEINEGPVAQTITRSRRIEDPVENRTAPVVNVITSSKAQGENPAQPVEDVAGAVASAVGERQVKPARSVPAPESAPPPRQEYAPAAGANDGARSGGDVDLRLAAVRSSQAAVARRYNVVLSVEAAGDAINVYVRPNKEMSKAELDDLRSAIRAELGLSSNDSIIIR